MSKNDDLDSVLSTLTDEEDWKNLAKVLDLGSLPLTDEERTRQLNMEIRHNYGHTLANMFRDPYKPDYLEIVQETAAKLKIKVGTALGVWELEDRILAKVLETARKQIIKEKGQAAWNQIETEVSDQMEEAIRLGKVKPEVAAQLRGLGPAAMFAALVGGRLAGFALYMVANQAFFAIARAMGLRIGVAVAGPVIGGTLSFLLGPAGWLIGGLWFLLDLGGTNWKKVIPAVVLVAVFRRRQAFETTDPILG